MESDTIEHQHPPPDLWQILHSHQTQDGQELQDEHYYNRYGRQYRAATLNFGANYWNDVIQRGYSWTDFKSFIDQRECVYVGRFWIRKVGIQLDYTDTFMKLGSLYFAMNLQQTDHSDDEIKSLVLSFVKLLSLHPDTKRCYIFSQAKWWLSILNESDIVLDHLDIHQHDHLDATTLHLAAAMTKYLHLIDCSIVSTTGTPYPTPINHFTNNRLQKLRFRRTQIDVNVLASLIQESTALESFLFFSFINEQELHFTSDQWMTLMAVCSQCQMLETIWLNDMHVETDAWLPGLELLMRSQSLSDISYFLHSYESPTQQQIISDSLKVSRTNTIVQALMCNKNIIKLDVPEAEIDVATYQSTVLPILRCNKLWKNVPPFCRDMDDSRGSTQLLGRLLSHRLLHQNPSFLFELACEVNHQLSHLWHDGRHRRILMLEEDGKQPLRSKAMLAKLYKYDEVQSGQQQKRRQHEM